MVYVMVYSMLSTCFYWLFPAQKTPESLMVLLAGLAPFMCSNQSEKLHASH